MFWLVPVVIGRLLGEVEAPLPTLEERSVLFIKRKNVMVGDSCPGNDGGIGSDAGAGDGGPGDDAGPDASSSDAGVGDAGVSDAGVGDAGVGDAGTGACVVADAITMIVQPQLVQMVPNARFALLYVTPSRPVVSLSEPVFATLDSITATRVEYSDVYVEDPALGTECSTGCGGNAHHESSSGCGTYSDGVSWDPPGLDDAGLPGDDLTVDMVGPYEVVRAQPSDRAELVTWLDKLGYDYGPADLDAVEPYIADGFTVVAVRIAVDEPSAKLRPLAMTWVGSDIRLAAALARTSEASDVALTVYIAAESRHDLSIGALAFADRTNYGSMGFLTRHDVVLDQTRLASDDPFATPVFGDPRHRPVRYETREIRVPATVSCDEGSGGCCDDCSTRKQRTRIDLGLVVVAVAFALRRKRRCK